MKIAVVHDAVGNADSLDAKDVLIQAAAVKDALEALGHEVQQVPCDFDLAGLRHRLEKFGTELVFNLMESIEGHGRLIHLVPFCLDAWGIAYTGSPAEAMLITSNKVMAKKCMVSTGLPTAPWVGPYPERIRADMDDEADKTQWIIKSVWEHASIGVHQKGLVKVTGKKIWPLIKAHAKELNGDCFAEKFIDGREFNISVLAGPDGPQVLPAAEIIFDGFAPDKPKIVCYNAKWVEESFEYQNTPREFDLGPEDGPLVRRMQDIAARCWEEFGLAGYVRVDFRVDDSGNPWILEINANPCISPDGGFAAAVDRAGISYTEAIQRIVNDIKGGRL
jgi:D-alanine-D-alanine ligase